MRRQSRLTCLQMWLEAGRTSDLPPGPRTCPRQARTHASEADLSSDAAVQSVPPSTGPEWGYALCSVGESPSAASRVNPYLPTPRRVADALRARRARPRSRR